MKILHLSQSDLSGGAAISAYRLHRGLLQMGVDSRMLVHDKKSEDPEIARLPQWHRIWRRLRGYIEYSNLDFSKNNEYCAWSIPLLRAFTPAIINSFQPDIVNLHGVDGIISARDLVGIKAPLVWTVHDEWAASCGYHFWVPDSEKSLKAGPQHSPPSTAATKLLQAKIRYWKDLNLTIISPSIWLAEQMRQAPHFEGHRIEVVPYGQETPAILLDRCSVRREFDIDEHLFVVTYGASESLNNFRKGDDLFFKAMAKLAENPAWQGKIMIMIFGDQPEHEVPKLPFPVLRHGASSDRNQLHKIYAMTDCFVCPSRADNLPNTVLEAMSLGTPCAGFRIGGLPDMIQDGITGFTAEPYDSTDLARAISDVLENTLTYNLRQKTQDFFNTRFTLNHQAQSYTKIYQEIL